MSSLNDHHGYGSEILHQTLDQTRFEKVHVFDMNPTGSDITTASQQLELSDIFKTSGIPFVIRGHTRFFLPAADWLKGTELDVDAVKHSIGKANVSVIDKQYNGEFKGTMTVSRYLDEYWTPQNDAMYMHQYQFPLDTDPGTSRHLHITFLVHNSFFGTLSTIFSFTRPHPLFTYFY